MNRFRKNKKKDTSEASENASTNPFSLKPSKKKNVEEQKPELDLDLSAALPSSDDFRTSLLMPKLSARFSMLREQDDPESKIGKASDDSVLFPRRASRLNLFGHSPGMLADIDEVESNDGSRPSFAAGRSESFAEAGDGGYGTDDDRSTHDSIMSRARRVEGNNLFGGRQKIYRIPTRSPMGSPATNSPVESNKAVYEHDLHLSAFQRFRRQEKDRKDRLGVESAYELTTSEFDDSLSTASSANRTTQSSTASGPPIIPSSATSIDEPRSATQSPALMHNTAALDELRPPSGLSSSNIKPSSVRARRLYGQGLNQNVQNQQNSALHRLENLSRQRAGTPDLAPMNRNFSRSAINLRDRLQKLSTTDHETTSRPSSPPSSTTSPKQATDTENVPKERVSPTVAAFGAPPLSPPSSDTGDGSKLLAAALHPEDHGKATAMGLFNRPATGFDEQQFSRRQMQMYQGRDTPPPQRPSPPNRAMTHEPTTTRSRGMSKSSFRSRAESASSHYSSDVPHVEHSRESSMDIPLSQPNPQSFYAESTTSDSENEREERQERRSRRSYVISSATSLASDYAFSLQQTSTVSKSPVSHGDQLETLPEVRYSDLRDLKPIEEIEISDDTPAIDLNGAITPERPDSPTIHSTGFHLNGIRTHLRTTSDRSSIFPPPSPAFPPQPQEDTSNTETVHETLAEAAYEPVSEVVSEVVSERPSPLNEYQQFIGDSRPISPLEDSVDPVAEPTIQTTADPEPAAEQLTSHRYATPRESVEELANRSSGDSDLSRPVVTTRDFAYGKPKEDGTEPDPLPRPPSPRTLIREQIRGHAEGPSRPSSPMSMSGRETPDTSRRFKPGNAFSLLKSKSSKHNLSNADHMYGLDSSSTPAFHSEDFPTREDIRPPFALGRQTNSSAPQVAPPQVVPERPSVSERPSRSRMPTISREPSRDSSRSRGTSPSAFSMSRDRGNSDASGRSKSRTRFRERERDDLETVEEGTVIAHDNFVIPDNYEPPVPFSLPGSTRPSMEVDPLQFDRSASAASGRHRSTSRSGTPTFHYEKGTPFQYPPMPSPSAIGAPRPSPATPAYSANATPPLDEVNSEDPSPVADASNNLPQRSTGQPALLHKRTVNKKEISEPTFVSTTSNVPTVGLPGGTPPPLPPMNPRRRRGTQTILSAFNRDSRASSATPSVADDQSVFEPSVFPEDEKRPMSRGLLRKTPSESSSLSTGATQEADSHSFPPAPEAPSHPPPPVPANGGMF